MHTIFNKINSILPTKEKAVLLCLMVMLFIGGIFDLLGVSLILPIVKVITDASSVNDNKWVKSLAQLLNICDSKTLSITLIAVMIFVYIVKNLYIIFMYKAMYKILWKYKADMSMRLLSCYIYQDYTFHLNKNVSELQRNIFTDVGQFYGFIMDALNLFNQTVVCILLSIYLLVVDWKTTLGVMLLLGSAILILYSIQKRVQVKLGGISRDASEELNRWVIQSFSGIKEVKVFSREEFFLEKCRQTYKKSMDANRKSNIASLVPKPMMEMICISGLLLVILVQLLLGADPGGFVATLAVFAVAAFRMLPCFNSISAYLATMLFDKNSVEAVYADLKEMEELSSATKTENKTNLHFNETITIQGLQYTYPNTEKAILNGIDLTIHKNQSIGFIGASGAGKSTLIDVILGVLPISIGKICVDGVDIYNNIKAWHNMIGYIPQSIYLMDDTIRNNVAFGIAKDQISDEQIWRALKEAQIDTFVKSLPKGLDAEIGDRGVRISGGQRQRLGIARALYHNPEILVFDEATSALDNETEAALMEAINGLKGTRTMLIIAHRLNTIEKCDVIYEVKTGKLVLKKS